VFLNCSKKLQREYKRYLELGKDLQGLIPYMVVMKREHVPNVLLTHSDTLRVMTMKWWSTLERSYAGQTLEKVSAVR
jgi:hypothetical protein